MRLTAGETPALGRFLPETAITGEQRATGGLGALVPLRRCQLQGGRGWVKQKGPACFGDEDLGSRDMPTV